METKKITFGFTKTMKQLQPQLQLNKKQETNKNKVELITCLEGKEIKLVNENAKLAEKPLTIPLQNSSKTSRALESLKMRKAVLEGLEVEKKDTNENTGIHALENSKLDSLEKRAITELLIEARNESIDDSENTTSKLTLVVKPEDLPLDGAKESTVDDYENIPINQFGMAMLRGMGLKEENIKKINIEDDILCPRPKGMGLGADKAIKRQPMLIPPEENEKLEIKKNAYIKILAGKYKSQYGQIESMDDRTGRVIVKLALGGSKESLGEYLLQAISKQEYQTYGKVINSVKYEEYKKKQTENEFKQEKYIKEEPMIKTENIDKSYDKYYGKNSEYKKSSVHSSDDEQHYKSEIKNENFKIKVEKNDSDKYNSRNDLNDLKNKGSSSQRYSSEEKKLSRSHKHSNSSRYRNNKYDNYKDSRQYNHDDDNNENSKNTRTKRRSRSRDFRRRKSESNSDSSVDSPERYRNLKKKSSKSKKSKKNKHKYNSSSEDDKKHKKKTKKSRKSRSRSRSRHRK